MVTQEGTRPLLVEIQALVDASQSPNPRRLTVGLEQHRLAMLLAVLHRHAGIVCFDQDVFVNAVGGVRITEPAADLPVLLAIVSSLKKQAICHRQAGGLWRSRPGRRDPSGAARPGAPAEAAKLGFTHAMVPKANAPRQAIKGLDVIALDRVEEAIERMRHW
jgi:DNA repair protein RadA/Sms